ncbi:hypothetical protein LJC55_02515 [Eubacteriales bacterium OttesenSCG-928-N14]|nr:hypothetical protein [Eubacteriales bacterium OttesenSCG-928-N14]
MKRKPLYCILALSLVILLALTGCTGDGQSQGTATPQPTPKPPYSDSKQINAVVAKLDAIMAEQYPDYPPISDWTYTSEDGEGGEVLIHISTMEAGMNVSLQQHRSDKHLQMISIYLDDAVATEREKEVYPLLCRELIRALEDETTAQEINDGLRISFAERDNHRIMESDAYSYGFRNSANLWMFDMLVIEEE